MDRGKLHSESLKETVERIAPKIEGITTALDQISSDIKWIEEWLNTHGVRVETEVWYWKSPLSGNPKAEFRPDQGRVIRAPKRPQHPTSVTASAAPTGFSPAALEFDWSPVVSRCLGNLRNQQERMCQVWQRFHAIAWAPMPDGRWRLQFREYSGEGVAYLDEATGEIFEDETIESWQQVGCRPLIETPAPIRCIVGDNRILERLLVHIAEETPEYGDADGSRRLRDMLGGA